MTDDRLLWLDLETTGLTPGSPDRLLQVSGFVTDFQLHQLSDEFDEVVHYGAEEVAAMRDQAEPLVRDMHDATGLWGRLPGGKPLDQVDAELSALVAGFETGDVRLRIAGSSCSGVDVPFSAMFLPHTHSRLHYQVVDVTPIAVVAAAFGWTDGRFRKAKNHNALDDIRESIAELAWIRSQVECQFGTPGVDRILGLRAGA